ncbi:MAG: molybdopterin-dependent oxidoreductase [Myxococcales bacterium]|nr:molybdopterin-dependent oxidoreductase [Myxococcales bacterium]MCB9705338.1 molybdopterin-dependent oxidoreductase [Myxococcales bacterium]
MNALARRLSLALALLGPSAAVACGAEAPLTAVDAIAVDHLEIVQGDRRLADTTLAHVRGLPSTTLNAKRPHTGVPLAALLRDLGVDPAGLQAIEALAADGYSARLDATELNAETTLVVHTTDDAALADHEGPLRLIVAGDRARSVRQLRRIVLNP